MRWIFKDRSAVFTLPDPRVPLSLHIGWKNSCANYTTFSLPEPINYTHAIYAAKPIELDGVKFQVFYRYLDNWISLYRIETPNYNISTLLKLDCLAAWQIHKRPRLKNRIIFTRENRQRDDYPELTPGENLYLSGYYNYLYKYFSDGLSDIVGKPRLLAYNIIENNDDSQ